jgi:hypothetical protein
VVAWWKLDDGMGGVAADSSGNGNTATLKGGPAWGTGRSGGDLTFNGVDQEADSTQGVPVTDVLSFSFWVETTSSSNHGFVFSLGQYATCELGYSVGVLACSPDGELQLTAPLAADGQWHLVVYVSAGAASTQSVYVDGVFQMSAVGTLNQSQGTSVCIASGCGQYFVDASLEDVRVYDRALDASDVAALL